ncbi:rRNA pseudouridine synthase [bacterium]|nr:rRNA pseudouridine synthase [bacterium]
MATPPRTHKTDETKGAVDELRLVVYLARAGVASRRGAGDVVAEGRVKVNGAVITNPAHRVHAESDHVRVDDKLIKRLEPHQYIMLNKPRGVVTTSRDPEGRPTVFDYLARMKAHVQPVGRLDFDTEGLLLLTNDGPLAYRLTRPEHHVEKVYIALVKGRVSRDALTKLRGGVSLDGRRTRPADVNVLEVRGDNTELRVRVVEGKYRQVRRICEAVGHPVKKLRRIAFGPLALGDLPRGKTRHLSEEEIKKLRAGEVRCDA